MGNALLQTITGFLVVIIGMLILTAVIILFSKLMGKNSTNKTVAVKQVEKPVTPVAEIYADFDDEEEIAAVMACIEAYLQQNSIKNVCNIVVRPLVRTVSSSTWSQAGRINLVNKKV
ncbi:MAG: OadG family protein [Clostridia bacterium]|nr:OadG family protein [Clostridia bacterium]